MSVLDELRTHLAALGTVGAAATWFTTALPTKPHVCQSILETGGTAPDRNLGSTVALFENPAVQIICRGLKDDYNTPRARAKLVWAAMIAIAATTDLSGTNYYMIQALQSPFPLGEDEDGRERIACNFLIQKDPS